MKFTLAWLKEHLETDRPLEDIVEKLSMIGLEVANAGAHNALLPPQKGRIPPEKRPVDHRGRCRCAKEP